MRQNHRLKWMRPILVITLQ